MFTELLQAEAWKRKLEAAGYRVIPEPYELRPGPVPDARDGGSRGR